MAFLLSHHAGSSASAGCTGLGAHMLVAFVADADELGCAVVVEVVVTATIGGVDHVMHFGGGDCASAGDGEHAGRVALEDALTLFFGESSCAVAGSGSAVTCPNHWVLPWCGTTARAGGWLCLRGPWWLGAPLPVWAFGVVRTTSRHAGSGESWLAAFHADTDHSGLVGEGEPDAQHGANRGPVAGEER